MKNLITPTLLLCTTFTLICMDANVARPLSPLPDELVCALVATSDGATKNNLAKTCKTLHSIASFTHRKELLQHPSIKLGTLEKSLLLVEYMQEADEAMVKHMFALGATYDVLSIFGEWETMRYITHSMSVSLKYLPYYASFPKNRIPSACTDKGRTLLHVAIAKKQYAIAKIILDQAAMHREKIPHFINTRDADLNTPLHLTVEQNDVSLATLLLSYKALNIQVRHIYNGELNDPLTSAQNKNLESMTQLLLDHTLTK